MLNRFILSSALLMGAISAHANFFTDPGFESVGSILGDAGSFRAYPDFDAGWTATQTDGEVFESQTGRAAHSGNWYADVLQNGGGNPNTYWNETGSTFGDYDRITTLVSVNPNTTYDFSFWHAGGDRFGYTAANTLVQIQSMQTTDAITDLSATPGLFDWQQRSIQFTTDATTTQLAFSFSSFGSTDSSVLIDSLSLTQAVPEPGTMVALGIGALAAFRRKRKA